MLIRGHYPDPAALGNEQVLMPVGGPGREKRRSRRGGEGNRWNHWQAGGRPWLSLCSGCPGAGGRGLVRSGSGTEVLG